MLMKAFAVSTKCCRLSFRLAGRGQRIVNRSCVCRVLIRVGVADGVLLTERLMFCVGQSFMLVLDVVVCVCLS